MPRRSATGARPESRSGPRRRPREQLRDRRAPRRAAPATRAAGARRCRDRRPPAHRARRSPEPTDTCSGRIVHRPGACPPRSRRRLVAPKKRAAAPEAGTFEEGARVVVLNDPALEHQRDRLPELGGLGAVVGDEQRRQPALLLQSHDQASQGLAPVRIERRERLVHEQQLGLATRVRGPARRAAARRRRARQPAARRTPPRPTSRS